MNAPAVVLRRTIDEAVTARCRRLGFKGTPARFRALED